MSLKPISLESFEDFLDDPLMVMVVLHLEKYTDGCWRPNQCLVDIFDRLNLYGCYRRSIYKKLRKSGVLLTAYHSRGTRCFHYAGIDCLYYYIARVLAGLKEILAEQKEISAGLDEIKEIVAARGI